MSEPLQILLLSGSLRQPSYTHALTSQVQATLIRRNARAVHWSLRDARLPVADPAFHNDPASHPDEVVRRLVAAAAECNAFVLASPIYHNSYSGVLKSALDHLAIPQFQYKPVGLISHGGNRSTQAVDHLRIVVRGLLGVAIPAQVCTAVSDYRTEPEGYAVQSEDILQRIERFVLELQVFAESFRRLRA